MFRKILSALKIILLPILVGALSGLLISGNTDVYDVLIKPPFALPGNLFGIVWGVLFLLMGISLYLYTKEDMSATEKREGKTLFFIQLLLNFLWPILFFNFEQRFLAFLLLIVLFVFIVLTTIEFYRKNRLSGILLLPYLLYTAYAGYLNFAIWYLNL